MHFLPTVLKISSQGFPRKKKIREGKKEWEGENIACLIDSRWNVKTQTYMYLSYENRRTDFMLALQIWGMWTQKEEITFYLHRWLHFFFLIKPYIWVTFKKIQLYSTVQTFHNSLLKLVLETAKLDTNEREGVTIDDQQIHLRFPWVLF